jgi:hypothetical protein
MKQITFRAALPGIYFLSMLSCQLSAQQFYGIFKQPLLTIDFNSASPNADFSQARLENYHRDYTQCPNDGYYSFAPSTSDCFNGDWLTFNEDHTPGDIDGKMMLVNANPYGGIFFNMTINGLRGNTMYQFSAWMVNVCRISGGCAPLPPNVIIILRNLAGNRIASFQTGLLSQNATPQWKRYYAMFATPPDVTSITLTMEDVTLGGCGNDFAMDDIMIREYVIPAAVAKAQRKPSVKPVQKPNSSAIKRSPGPTIATTKPALKKPQPFKKDSPVAIVKIKERDTPEIVKPLTRKQVALPLPKPILTRENPLIKRIDIPAGEIIIDLYDNGQIDGDTVSIYHNNELIVSKAALSAKPITIHIKLDAMDPHHELIMVAENLGSIPPNTSLMIITAGKQRFQVFISSSEQKNAKIAIDLKE